MICLGPLHLRHSRDETDFCCGKARIVVFADAHGLRDKRCCFSLQIQERAEAFVVLQGVCYRDATFITVHEHWQHGILMQL